MGLQSLLRVMKLTAIVSLSWLTMLVEHANLQLSVDLKKNMVRK